MGDLSRTALKPDARIRARADIAAILHLYLDPSTSTSTSTSTTTGGDRLNQVLADPTCPPPTTFWTPRPASAKSSVAWPKQTPAPIMPSPSNPPKPPSATWRANTERSRRHPRYLRPTLARLPQQEVPRARPWRGQPAERKCLCIATFHRALERATDQQRQRGADDAAADHRQRQSARSHLPIRAALGLNPGTTQDGPRPRASAPRIGGPAAGQAEPGVLRSPNGGQGPVAIGYPNHSRRGRGQRHSASV